MRSSFTVNGVRVAHLAYTRFSNTDSLALAPWQLNYVADAGRVIGDVLAARAAGADVVIVSVHLRQRDADRTDPRRPGVRHHAHGDRARRRR